MGIAHQTISLPQWSPIIEEHLSSDEPIVNLADGGQEVYDAIFIGGGAAGRFSSAYLKALGGVHSSSTDGRSSAAAARTRPAGRHSRPPARDRAGANDALGGGSRPHDASFPHMSA